MDWLGTKFHCILGTYSATYFTQAWKGASSGTLILSYIRECIVRPEGKRRIWSQYDLERHFLFSTLHCLILINSISYERVLHTEKPDLPVDTWPGWEGTELESF
jgi:hypothetical protein